VDFPVPSFEVCGFRLTATVFEEAVGLAFFTGFCFAFAITLHFSEAQNQTYQLLFLMF
jgi:hypothetical protein